MGEPRDARFEVRMTESMLARLKTAAASRGISVSRMIRVWISEKMAGENAHSLLGASSCERWWNCPGNTRLIQECGELMTVHKGTMHGTGVQVQNLPREQQCAVQINTCDGDENESK